jgi:hypothetical protein
VKARPITVHAIEVFDHRLGISKTATAVWALVVKPLPDQFLVFLTINSDAPILGDFPAQLVKEHADDLVRHVGLSPPRSRA